MAYGDLARELDLRMGALTVRLEAMMEEDASRGAPFRAAVLRQKLSAQALPARGFFEKAAVLGCDVGDPVALVAAHRRRLRGA